MKHIYFIGDLHGSFKGVRDLVERCPQISRNKNKYYHKNILVCLGDFGGNYFGNYRDDEFKSKLEHYPFDAYFVIRGNHEERASNCAKKNPDKWHTETFFGNEVYVENAHPCIKYALDVPAVYQFPYVKVRSIEMEEDENGELPVDIIKTLDVLVIPGAFSIDKMHRILNGWSWFPEEQLSPKERQIGIDLCEKYAYRFDIVLSHTCPICFEPTDLFFPCIDQSKVDKTMEKYMGQLECKMSYDFWLWGHYHEDRIYPTHKQIMLFGGAVELQDMMDGEIDIL